MPDDLAAARVLTLLRTAPRLQHRSAIECNPQQTDRTITDHRHLTFGQPVQQSFFPARVRWGGITLAAPKGQPRTASTTTACCSTVRARPQIAHRTLAEANGRSVMPCGRADEPPERADISQKRRLTLARLATAPESN